MARTLEEFIKEYEQAETELWEKTKISVMVFGPSLNYNKLSSRLRKYLIDKCNEHHIVVRTEHENIIDIHKKVFGPGRDLCHMELKAAAHVDAIIMIPDSPGSFVELGMFSIIEPIRKKTMIIFDYKYTSPDARKSFVHLGPIAAYDAVKSPIEYISYRSKRLIWEKVNSFLLGKKAGKCENSIVKELMP